jgi:hypothetical protein
MGVEMELHNHLARPEPHNALRTVDYWQSFAEHADVLILHTTQIVVDAGNRTHMPTQHSLAPEVMS